MSRTNYPKLGIIAKAILGVLVVSGTIALAITAPNIFQVFSMYGKIPKRRNSNLRKSIKTLEKNQLIKIHGPRIRVTSKGVKFYNHCLVDDINLNHAVSDGYDRYVIFDVANVKDRERRLFVHKLKALGFEYVQKSVWRHTVPCEEELKQIAQCLLLRNSIQVIRVAEVMKI